MGNITGLRLRQVMKARKISQKELAEHLGVHRSVVWRWYNGEFTPKTEHLLEISKFLKVKPAYLLGKTDKAYSEEEKNDELIDYIKNLDANDEELINSITNEEYLALDLYRDLKKLTSHQLRLVKKFVKYFVLEEDELYGNRKG